MSHTDRDCERVQQQLWRYVDRELPARELAEISESLRDCPDCRQAYEERARDSRLYRLAFTERSSESDSSADAAVGRSGPTGEASFLERFRAEFDREGLDRINDRRAGAAEQAFDSWTVDLDLSEAEAEKGAAGDSLLFEGLDFDVVDASETSRGSGSSSRRGRGVWGRRSGMRREFGRKLIELRGSSPQRRRRLLVVAALLFLIPATVGLGIFLTHRHGHGLGVYKVIGDGVVEVLRPDGKSHIAAEGDASSTTDPSILRAGSVFRVPDGVELKLEVGQFGLGQSRDKSRAARLRIRGPSKFEVLSDASIARFHGRLHDGQVHCLVAQRGEDESFRIDTLTHRVEVIGTEFTVFADGREPVVLEGKVAFGALPSRRNEWPSPESEMESVRYLTSRSSIESVPSEASGGVGSAATDPAAGARVVSENLQPPAPEKPASTSSESTEDGAVGEVAPDVKESLDKPVGSVKRSDQGIRIED